MINLMGVIEPQVGIEYLEDGKHAVDITALCQSKESKSAKSSYQ